MLLGLAASNFARLNPDTLNTNTGLPFWYAVTCTLSVLARSRRVKNGGKNAGLEPINSAVVELSFGDDDGRCMAGSLSTLTVMSP